MRAFAATDPGSRWEARLIRSAHPVVAVALDALVTRKPVCRLPGVGVLVAEPSGARQVLGDTEHFAKNGPGSSGALWTPVLGERVLLNMEGEEHRALRRVLADLFAPRVVGQVCEAAVQPLVDEAVASLRAGGQVDVARLAGECAAAAISVVVGLDPASHRQHLLDASQAIERLITWRTKTLDAAMIATARAHLEPIQDAAALAHARGDEATVMGRLASLGVGVQEARSLAAALFLTGTGTVSAALPRIIGQLGDAGYLARGSFDTKGFQIDAVISEGLRMTTPSLATLRRCIKDTDVNGIRVREGERVLVLLWWATRLDGGFDPGRRSPSEMRQLWFGAGSHFCLGAPLALEELRRMVTGLVGVAQSDGLRIISRTAERRILVPRYRSLVISR